MSVQTLVILVVGVSAAVTLSVGRRAPVLALYLVLAGIFAMRRIPSLLDRAPVAYHAGIADSGPYLHVAVLGVLVALIMIGPARSGRFGDVAAPAVAVVVLIAATPTIWAGSPAQWSGVLLWATAAGAWACGRSLGRLQRAGPALVRHLVLIVLIFAALQFTMAALQSIGVLAAGVDESGNVVRARGTFSHPGDLGKVLVAAMAMILPNEVGTPDATTRRRTRAALLLATGAMGLTVSRANVAALFVLIVSWVILNRAQAGQGRRVRLLLLSAVAILPFVGTLAARFAADQEGGSRPDLLAAALTQIARNPWVGTGPNSYVQVVGQFDAATAMGLPVHNAFVLTIAELGIPIAVAGMSLGLAAVVRVWLRRHRHGAAEAAAFLALVCAAAVIAWTGWGIYKIEILAMYALAFGYLSARTLGPSRRQLRTAARPQPVANGALRVR